MCKPVTYDEDELWSNDDDNNNDHDHDHDEEHNRKENSNSSTGTMKNVDKGKESVEEDRYCKKRKDRKKRITWTSDLHKMFVEAINSLGKEKAYPTTILEAMKVPGLTRSQVASHLQKYHEHLKNSKNPTLVPQMQEGNSLQVDKIFGQSDNHASSTIIQPPLKLNSKGISFMTINNIKARLKRAPTLPLHVPQPTATINFDSDQTTENQPSILINNTSFGSVGSSNSTTIGKRNELLITGNDYGSAIENLRTPLGGFAVGGGTSNHNNPQHLPLPKFVSGNLDLLEDVVHSINPNFYNSDSLLPFEVGSHLEMTVNLLDELDDHLINGPW